MSDGTELRDGLSLVIPAYNEQEGVAQVIEDARATLALLSCPYEIIVVDDCSTDRTAEIAAGAGVTVLRNLQNGGYGYSLMRGIRHASMRTVAIADADGSYSIAELPGLYEEYRRGFSMVVGSRHGAHYTGSARMRLLRWLFRGLTQFTVGQRVPDVNSGLRVFERAAVLPLFPHMSYGFSFTTSITLLFMLQALPVAYIPVSYLERKGTSKVQYRRDSLRALQILVSITARLNPIKLFLLAALVNSALLVPAALVSPDRATLVVASAVILAASAIIVALGFVVEGLADKTALTTSARGGSSSSRPAID